MAGKYYYLVASLPFLKRGESVIKKEGFFEECSKWLSEKDIRILQQSESGGDGEDVSGCSALRDWKLFDSGFKEDILLVREAARSGNAAESQANEKIRSVFEQETPLLMEKKLAQIKLDFIEGEASRYFFDINWLVLYYLKLQILERLSVFDKDEGEKFFYEVCEVKYEK